MSILAFSKNDRDVDYILDVNNSDSGLRKAKVLAYKDKNDIYNLGANKNLRLSSQELTISDAVWGKTLSKLLCSCELVYSKK